RPNRRESNAPRRHAHRGSRSTSLTDRRGLITAPRLSARKSSISPMAHHRKQDVESVDTLAMLMHFMEEDGGEDPLHKIFLPMRHSASSPHKPLLWKQIQKSAPITVDSSAR
ncbi:unnamed protein product, partial [Gongylonema pulchrum]|uniref:PWI domain-containing protein n=1 Tax=Gongylonema pulchrum TaxID=637853 RepID=A0A183DII2_9BILA